MDEGRFDELMYRLQTLEAEKKRWRSIALLLSAAIVMGVLCGGASTVGLTSMYWSRAAYEREMEMQMRQEAEVARMQADQARQQAEQALKDEKAKQNADK